MVARFAELLKDIKIQHTVFALPFALMSAFIAAGGWPGWRVFLLILLCMVFARSAAMAFNRLADERFDRQNPRTMLRALPAGLATRLDYALFTAVSSAGFIGACLLMNRLAFMLSVPALLIIFFYSYTKRFTSYSHFFLGLALALAPVGGWVAVRADISIAPLILGSAVLFWLAGLDTIYACQDVEFDRAHGLNSLPGRLGVKKALTLAGVSHGVMVALLLLLGGVTPLSWIYMAGVFFTGAMLLYEHSLVSPDDLTRVNVAFFNVNGMISVGLLLFTIADVSLISR